MPTSIPEQIHLTPEIVTTLRRRATYLPKLATFTVVVSGVAAIGADSAIREIGCLCLIVFVIIIVAARSSLIRLEKGRAKQAGYGAARKTDVALVPSIGTDYFWIARCYIRRGKSIENIRKIFAAEGNFEGLAAGENVITAWFSAAATLVGAYGLFRFTQPHLMVLCLALWVLALAHTCGIMGLHTLYAVVQEAGRDRSGFETIVTDDEEPVPPFRARASASPG